MVNKILYFPNFSQQSSQSYLLSPSIGVIIAWVIPIVEFVITVMLALPKYRFLGLYGGTGMMVVFTQYLYINFNFSGYVPAKEFWELWVREITYF